ncbi:LLM class flavin-dependent oxidoreductase [Neobacillus niacini]|uniref:LLM class flavin-dependent oxidoreductase n=1 Tax=Neobacillus niacini TaxID=86668 RepID=UPI002FFDA241
MNFEPYRSNVPVYFGVKGPKALRMAGRIADGVLTSIMTSLDYLDYVKERIKEGAEEAGRAHDEIKIASYLLIYISHDVEQAKRLVKPMIAKYLGMHGDHAITRNPGLGETDINLFKRAFIKGEDANKYVKDWMIDTFAIVGTPQDCRQKLQAYREAGVDYPIAFQIPGVPIEETIQQIKEHVLNGEI